MAEVVTVLHVVEASFAGVGRHVVDLAHNQARMGHKVHVAFSPLRESEQFRQGRFDADAVTWHSVDIPHKPEFGDVAAHRSLKSLVSQLEPDVVHGHSTKGGMHVALLRRLSACTRSTVAVFTPNALLSMNPTLSRAVRAAVASVERQILASMTRVIAVSPEEHEYLISLGVKPGKVSMVPNGIEPIERVDRDDVRRQLGIGMGAALIGFVGRLDSQKSPLSLIEVFNRLGGERDDLELAVVGSGKLLGELRAAADRSPFRDRIHLLGEQPGTWAMQAFDLFLLPSVYEGFPYVLIEAAHLGIPIVTTLQASARQLEQRSNAVLRVEAGNVDGLAAACSDLIARHPRTLNAEALTDFSVGEMTLATGEAYDHTLSPQVDLRAS